MLRQTLQKRTKRTFRTKIYQMGVCYSGDQLILCRHCGYFIAPLSAVSHYLNIDIENYRFGNHFFALQRCHIHSLNHHKQPAFLHTEQPFLLMFLEPVECVFCKQSLGVFFLTANMNRTEWLLNRFILNMEKIELNNQRSLLMENTINQLHGQLTKMQIKKAENKAYFTKVIDKQKKEVKKVSMVKQEKDIEKLILSNTRTSYPQNKKKGELAAKIISNLAFFDRQTQKMEKEGKSIIEKSQALKLKMIEKYEQIQQHKLQMLKMKNSISEGPSNQAETSIPFK